VELNLLDHTQAAVQDRTPSPDQVQTVTHLSVTDTVQAQSQTKSRSQTPVPVTDTGPDPPQTKSSIHTQSLLSRQSRPTPDHKSASRDLVPVSGTGL
jgi:hypothetical protein